MNIPVFHDDQHGTAIIVAAAIVNGMEVAGKKLEDIKIVTSGAGAAALACLNLICAMGVKPENVWLTDIDGVVYEGRDNINQYMAPYAKQTEARGLADVIEGADVFLGLSAGNILKPDMVKRMADKPLIMALANPNPEINPAQAREARPDAMICTGRSDFPNQVNNVLCFPYIFRGALDCGARAINEEMKIAATLAIAALAHEPTSETAAQAYEGGVSSFGPESLIPNPFDQRLILRIAPAVAKAAMESGVSARPIQDFDAYNEKLTRFVFRSGMIMRPVFAAARKNLKRIIYAEGEDERVLRAAAMAKADGWATPILIGRPDVIERRAAEFGLSIKAGDDVEVINPNSDPRYHDYINTLVQLAGRKWRAAQRCTHPGAHQLNRHRQPGRQARRCGRHDLRAGRPVLQPSGPHQAHHRAGAAHPGLRNHFGMHSRSRHLLLRRHLRQRGSLTGAHGPADPPRCRHRQAVQHRAQGSLACQFVFRLGGKRFDPVDARYRDLAA
jgi:malate dehydrogenase (oxaloacetate-decarboxylating)(NADP+)